MTTLASDAESRRQRARIALDGLSLGDAFGERFFAREAEEWLAKRTLPPAPWRYTDDTEMALGLYDCLVRHGRVLQDDLATIFAARYHQDPWKGYGGTVRGVLRGIHDGIPWRMLSKAAYGGEGSMGNGSAMRVGVLGAWFADDLERVVHEARLSAEVTHAHADGIAGAIASAVATAMIWRMPSFEQHSSAPFLTSLQQERPQITLHVHGIFRRATPSARPPSPSAMAARSSVPTPSHFVCGWSHGIPGITSKRCGQRSPPKAIATLPARSLAACWDVGTGCRRSRRRGCNCENPLSVRKTCHDAH